MGNRNKSNGGIIYSSEHGKMCPSCKKPSLRCVCHKKKMNSTQVNTGGTVEVRRETKGRKGSGVIVIRGIPLNKADLISFGKHLKKKCGSGGTIKDGAIEIQGENCELIMEEIKKQGWKVKRTGG